MTEQKLNWFPGEIQRRVSRCRGPETSPAFANLGAAGLNRELDPVGVDHRIIDPQTDLFIRHRRLRVDGRSQTVRAADHRQVVARHPGGSRRRAGEAERGLEDGGRQRRGGQPHQVQQGQAGQLLDHGERKTERVVVRHQLVGGGSLGGLVAFSAFELSGV